MFSIRLAQTFSSPGSKLSLALGLSVAFRQEISLIWCISLWHSGVFRSSGCRVWEGWNAGRARTSFHLRSRENLDFQQFINQTENPDLWIWWKISGVCSFSSVKQNQTDTRENRIFEAILRGILAQNNRKQKQKVHLSLKALCISLTIPVSSAWAVDAPVLNDKWLIFPCAPDPAGKADFLMCCVFSCKWKFTLGLFSCALLSLCSSFFGYCSQAGWFYSLFSPRFW